MLLGVLDGDAENENAAAVGAFPGKLNVGTVPAIVVVGNAVPNTAGC